MRKAVVQTVGISKAGISEVELRRIALVTLDTLFITVVFLASQFQKVEVSLQDLGVLALATFFLAQTISFREIAEPIRAPFTEVLPDSCGAGEDVHPRGSGFQYVIGSLLSCPVCTGTWSALALYSLWSFVPMFGRYLVHVLAIAGVVVLLHYASCNLEWNGRLARVKSGAISPDK